ncbi:hypothetical protein GR927_10685 [Mycolicibacterium sp. 3033]|nr:hypothetical protein [Mycolicibacterium aurantiacum]
MSETPPPSSSPSSPPPEENDPATGPVFPPPGYNAPPTGYAQPSSTQPGPPQTVYVERSGRLNKVAAWVGIVAGSLFIVVVIFGAGFFTGKSVGNHRDHDGRGHELMMRPGTAMFPMGPPGGMQRGPAFPGPFGPGQIIEIPRPPGGAPGGSSDTPTTPRP